jgi:hypothetical protein
MKVSAAMFFVCVLIDRELLAVFRRQKLDLRASLAARSTTRSEHCRQNSQ